jgi:hypothetical protein
MCHVDPPLRPGAHNRGVVGSKPFFSGRLIGDIPLHTLWIFYNHASQNRLV